MHAIRATSAFDGETFLPDGVTVLIDEERIHAVEPYGVAIPSDCTVDDYQGMLLPGLFDTHVHLVGDSERDALERVAGYSDQELDAVARAGLQRQLAAGVTTVRDLGDQRFNIVERRHRADEPTVLAAGPPITSVGGHCHYLGGVVTDAVGIKQAVAERVERQVDVVKVMASGGMLTPGSDQLGTQFSDDDLRLITDLAHAAGLPVAAHAHSIAAVRQAVRCGVDGIEHCTCLTEQGPIVDTELCDAIAAAGIIVCVTAGGDLSKMGPLPPHVRALLDRMGATPEQVLAHRSALTTQLHRSGVRLVMGADSGISDIKTHGIIGLTAADHREAGIPAADVLAGATSGAAQACGVGATKGRLRAGYDADLVVVGADLRTDPAALGDVRAVVLRGRHVSRESSSEVFASTGAARSHSASALE